MDEREIPQPVAALAAELARLPSVVACAGMLAHAVLCAAHARLAGRREWVLNEKRLVQRAGLDRLQPVLGAPGTTADELQASVAAASEALGLAPLEPR